MALRSPALFMGNPAINHTAQNDRLSKAGTLRAETGQTAGSRPLTAASGVLAGTPGTMGEVTLLSNTQFTVNPARWALMSSDTPLGGVYEVTNDAVETLAVTAQDATQFRKAYFGVWVIDSFVAGSGDDQPHWGLINGALAASNPQLPAAGALPENFLALGEFLIPPTGQAVTWTAYTLTTGLRGSIVVVGSSDTRAGPHDGSYRRHPTRGLEDWNASATKWRAPRLRRPSCWVPGISQSTIPTNTEAFLAAFAAAPTWDTDSLWGGAGGLYITVPTGLDGIWHVKWKHAFNGGTTGAGIITRLIRWTGTTPANGAVPPTLEAQTFSHPNTWPVFIGAEYYGPLSAGDKVGAWYIDGSTSILNVAQGQDGQPAYFFAEYVGPNPATAG